MHVSGVEHSACCQALVMNVVRMAAKSTRKTESGTLSSGILRCGCNDTSRNVSQRVGGEISVLNHCTGSRPGIFSDVIRFLFLSLKSLEHFGPRWFHSKREQSGAHLCMIAILSAGFYSWWLPSSCLIPLVSGSR